VNLWESLLAAARHPRARLWSNAAAAPEEIGWRQVVEDAETIACGLRARGVAGGDVVGAVLTNEPATIAGLLGIWLAGAAVASLPVPARGMDFVTYTGQLSRLARSLTVPFLLTDGRFAPLLDEGVDCDVLAWEGVRGAKRIAGEPPNVNELAFVQYSSGSTSTPKGCMLTGAAIAAQLELLLEMLEGVPGEETVVSWLPLSHDMGLFGCLLFAWAHGFTFVMSTPERFAHSPRTWFGDCADAGATLTAGTNLALRLAARAARAGRGLKPLRLRGCVVGAERVECEALCAAVAAYERVGLHAHVLTPAYGLAEATLAVSATPVRDAPRTIALDADELADGNLREVGPEDPRATLLVSAGRPCRGVSVRTCDASRLSEVCVRSPSLSLGYHEDPRGTRARFRDGELFTGDLGLMRDGQLFVVGRLDDILQVGGRNVYAAEIESAMSALEGVRAGCCVIVGGERSGGLVALAEVRGEGLDFGELATGMARVASRTAGVTLAECLFLPRGTLPKTPSGKVQRYRAHTLARDGDFEPLARVPLASRSA
jgi:fatty-acyl-CoA synthase